MRQPQSGTPNENPADTPLPDLGQLSIAGEDWERSLLLSPASPTPPTSPLPPRRSRNREARSQGRTRSDFPGVTVNINVHASTAPINVYNAPPSEREGQQLVEPRAAASPSSRGVAASPSTGQVERNSGASGGGGSSMSRGVRYTIRAGGKARVDWVPSLEHLDDGYAPPGKKWYVVTAGLQVGFWRNWLNMEEFVDVRGSRYQSCVTKEEAVEVYNRAKREGRVRQLLK